MKTSARSLISLAARDSCMPAIIPTAIWNGTEFRRPQGLRLLPARRKPTHWAKRPGAFTICRFEIPLDFCFEDALPLIEARLFEIKRSSLFGDRFRRVVISTIVLSSSHSTLSLYQAALQFNSSM